MCEYSYVVNEVCVCVHMSQTSGKRLGDWAFQQFEVVADKLHTQSSTVWNVEEHRYSSGQLVNFSVLSAVLCHSFAVVFGHLTVSLLLFSLSQIDCSYKQVVSALSVCFRR